MTLDCHLDATGVLNCLFKCGSRLVELFLLLQNNCHISQRGSETRVDFKGSAEGGHRLVKLAFPGQYSTKLIERVIRLRVQLSRPGQMGNSIVQIALLN